MNMQILGLPLLGSSSLPSPPVLYKQVRFIYLCVVQNCNLACHTGALVSELDFSPHVTARHWLLDLMSHEIPCGSGNSHLLQTNTTIGWIILILSFWWLGKAATWLILPVVIRSSQRLSHARLSINILLWNCEWLIISVIVYLIVPYYLDSRSNSRANTCVNTLLG